MARKLINELSWSRSRISTLDTCSRKYFYQYYLKWGGWDWNASEESRRAYLLSKMTGLPTMCGLAVHDTIKKLLEDYRDHGQSTVADPAMAARLAMTRVWRDGEARKWERAAKHHPPVFELYYGEAPPAQVLKEFGQKATRCLETFMASDLHAELKAEAASGHDWLAVDEGPSFADEDKLKLDGHTIWALPDFARRRADGMVEIWDWKTGAKSRHDEQQLLSYALHARDMWHVPADSIRLFGFYLDGAGVVEYPAGPERLEEMEDVIRADFERMKSFLIDADNSTPRAMEEAFSRIEDGDTCRRCYFKELCDRGTPAGSKAITVRETA